MDKIEELMLSANKARTDLLADNPEINSTWTPNAIEIIKQKEKKSHSECVHTQLHEAKVVDFTQDSEYKKLTKERLAPMPPMSPFGS